MNLEKEKKFIRGVGIFAGAGLAISGLSSEHLVNKVAGGLFGLLVAGLCFWLTKDIDSVSPKK